MIRRGDNYADTGGGGHSCFAGFIRIQPFRHFRPTNQCKTINRIFSPLAVRTKFHLVSRGFCIDTGLRPVTLQEGRLFFARKSAKRGGHKRRWRNPRKTISYQRGDLMGLLFWSIVGGLVGTGLMDIVGTFATAKLKIRWGG